MQEFGLQLIGVGKSRIIDQIKRRHRRNVVITATTAAAAKLINGETIHRFSGIGDLRYPAESYQAAVLQSPLYLDRIRYIYSHVYSSTCTLISCNKYFEEIVKYTIPILNRNATNNLVD